MEVGIVMELMIVVLACEITNDPKIPHMVIKAKIATVVDLIHNTPQIT
jgi:hypothetical protein